MGTTEAKARLEAAIVRGADREELRPLYADYREALATEGVRPAPLPPPLYMEDMIVALTRALREFDRENAVAADRHEPGCLCALCAFVRDVRSTLEET